jgi:hypothetical protein
LLAEVLAAALMQVPDVFETGRFSSGMGIGMIVIEGRHFSVLSDRQIWRDDKSMGYAAWPKTPATINQ